MRPGSNSKTMIGKIAFHKRSGHMTVEEFARWIAEILQPGMELVVHNSKLEELGIQPESGWTNEDRVLRHIPGAAYEYWTSSDPNGTAVVFHRYPSPLTNGLRASVPPDLRHRFKKLFDGAWLPLESAARQREITEDLLKRAKKCTCGRALFTLDDEGGNLVLEPIDGELNFIARWPVLVVVCPDCEQGRTVDVRPRKLEIRWWNTPEAGEIG